MSDMSTYSYTTPQPLENVYSQVTFTDMIHVIQIILASRNQLETCMTGKQLFFHFFHVSTDFAPLQTTQTHFFKFSRINHAKILSIPRYYTDDTEL